MTKTRQICADCDSLAKMAIANCGSCHAVSRETTRSPQSNHSASAILCTCSSRGEAATSYIHTPLARSVIVGYAGTATGGKGCTAIGVSFAAVSGTMDLQDVKVTGYDGAFEGDVYMQTLDAYGRTLDTYTWVDVPKDEAEPDSVTYYGWYDGENLIECVSVSPGSGYWVASDSSGYSIQSAGAVIANGASIALGAKGCTMVANPLPVSVDLQDIVVGGYEGAFEGDVYMQTLDPFGRTVDTYTWVDVPKDEAEPDSVTYYGWYDGENLIGDVVVQPGQGLWTASDSAAYSIVYPALTL